jgi:UDP-N-acetylglucosamine 1-carboxyvinyltransferase
MINENSYIKIKQSPSISGIIMVEGSKNAILPITKCSILSKGISILRHVPLTKDIESMIYILNLYGAKISYINEDKTLIIDSKNIQNTIIPSDIFSSYRASTLFAGALLSRFGEVWIGLPGGDRIGKRPIDIHLMAFEKMGAKIEYKDNYIYINSLNKNLTPAEIYLDYPSVGATQNIMLAAAGCNGTTIIKNAAQEPEIIDMASVLSSMGVKIEFKFQNTIYITGEENLKPFDHNAIPDRLEAGTFLAAAAITGGSIEIPNAPAYAMFDLLNKFEKMGHKIETGNYGFGVRIYATENPIGTNIKTMPFPGLHTDYQSALTALLSISSGTSEVHETVFESRMNHAYELNKMGANIAIEYDHAKIHGVEKLYGTEVKANDIRSCAALILAGLAAEGETIVYGVNHLIRGYYKLDERLQTLGADVEIINNNNIFTNEDLFNKTIKEKLI